MTDADLVQKAYISIQQHFIDTGRAPHFTELATTLGITPDEARGVQCEAALAGVGCWISADTDYIGSWAPFRISRRSTLSPYKVTRNGMGSEDWNRWPCAGFSPVKRYR